MLREFVTRRAKTNYRLIPPNRRYVSDGLYLPTIRGEELGDIILAVDTSGSVGEKELQDFGSEIQGILDSYTRARLCVLYHDTDVCRVQRWDATECPIELEPAGDGGTSHAGVWQWVEQNIADPCATCAPC